MPTRDTGGALGSVGLAFAIMLRIFAASRPAMVLLLSSRVTFWLRSTRRRPVEHDAPDQIGNCAPLLACFPLNLLMQIVRQTNGYLFSQHRKASIARDGGDVPDCRQRTVEGRMRARITGGFSTRGIL